MHKKQRALLETILSLPVGTILKKGERQRVLVGFNGFMIFYKTSETSKNTTGQNVPAFLKWAEAADVIRKGW